MRFYTQSDVHTHCMAQDEPPNVSVCALHSIFMLHDVCLSVRCLRPRSVLLLLLSVVYLFSSTLYLHSDQHFISNVNNAEGNNRCAFADPTLQDNVLIPKNFFEFIDHIGCAISLHSITNSGLIAGGQNSSRERQTVFFTAGNPMNKDHRDPHELDLTKPRLASYKQ